jgi:hypothetical protein
MAVGGPDFVEFCSDGGMAIVSPFDARNALRRMSPKVALKEAFFPLSGSKASSDLPDGSLAQI